YWLFWRRWGGVDELNLGYYLWCGSFAVVAFGLVLLAWPKATIPPEEALAIVEADAVMARGLTRHKTRVVLEDDGWHVDYELKNTRMRAVHYVLDALTGEIVSKRYDSGRAPLSNPAPAARRGR